MRKRIPKNIQKLENFIFKNTGVEFCFDQNWRVSGIQCTNPIIFKKFLDKEK